MAKESHSLQDACLQFCRYPPSPALTPYVRNYCTGRSNGRLRTPIEQRVVPDGCIDNVVCRANPTASFSTRIVGTMTRPLVDTLQGTVDFLGIRFSPGGFSRFFNRPAADFTDQLIPLEKLSGASVLSRTIAQTPDMTEVFLHLETFLLQKRHDALGDIHLADVFSGIETSEWMSTLAQFAQQAHCSERQLRRKFHKHIGVSPKMFCRIVRFKQALKALRRPARTPLLDIALDAGYYDQAHFIHDFKRFYGDTPSALQG